MSDSPESKKDWIDHLTRVAGAIGMNKIRVRWKLMGWLEKWKDSKSAGGAVAQHITYQHRVCPHCQNIQDRKDRVCTNCGHRLTPRFLEILGRFGIVTPHLASVSSLLTMAIILCYLRTVAAQDPIDVFNIDSEVLLRFGANYPPAIAQGEWWRLSTAIFLHAGLWHILFNLMALQQIGPQIEEVFGKGRFLFLFMVTGILASLGSELVREGGVGIGASGALMGIIGLAAGWGHRNGTTVGKLIRNQMVKWGFYTVIFGFLIGADNGAHIAGFVSGALLGLISKPRWERPRSSTWDILFGSIGALLAIGTFVLVMFPPS